MADRSRVIEGLLALPPRAWAVLLRELPAVVAAAPPPLADDARPDGVRRELAALAAGPRSAAAGPARGRIAELLEEDPELRALLAARPGLDAAVDALRADGERTAAADRVSAAVGHGTTGDSGVAEAAAARELRAELARTRRQREGAEARARAAEDRSAAAVTDLARATERLAMAEAALADAGATHARDLERAERRAAERTRDVDTALAAGRAERERLVRDLERERDAAVRLRAELERLRGEVAQLRAAAGAPRPSRRRPVGLPAGIAADTTEAARHLLAAVELVVVDGYNLTLRTRAGLDLAAQRRWLLDRLRPVAARGPRVVVVFDGDRGTGTRRAEAGLDVRFTPERVIADDEIEFVAGEAAADGTPTLVVTDDAELRRRVTAHDADVVGVLPFTGALG